MNKASLLQRQHQLTNLYHHYKTTLWETRTPQEKRTLRLGSLVLVIFFCGWQLHLQTQQSKQLSQKIEQTLTEHAELLHIQAQAQATQSTRYRFTMEEQQKALEKNVLSPQFESYMQLKTMGSAPNLHWLVQVEAIPASLLTQWLFQIPNQLQLTIDALTLQRSQKDGRELSAMLSGEIQLRPKEIQ